MSPKLRAALWPALFWLAVGLTAWFALMPPQGAGEPTFGWDKTDHLLAFGAMAVLACLAWPRLPWVRVLAALVAYGMLIEALQALVPGREASALDVLADALGACTGIAAGSLWRRRLARVAS